MSSSKTDIPNFKKSSKNKKLWINQGTYIPQLLKNAIAGKQKAIAINIRTRHVKSNGTEQLSFATYTYDLRIKAKSTINLQHISNTIYLMRQDELASNDMDMTQPTLRMVILQATIDHLEPHKNDLISPTMCPHNLYGFYNNVSIISWNIHGSIRTCIDRNDISFTLVESCSQAIIFAVSKNNTTWYSINIYASPNPMVRSNL